MNVTDITNSENKNPSEVLLSLIDKFSNVEMSRGELIQQIMNRARLEDIPTEQIRTLIVEQLKAKGLSDATIRRALPQELKHSEMIRVPKPKIEIEERQAQEDTDHPPVYREPDRVEPRPVWNKDKMSTVQEQQFNANHNVDPSNLVIPPVEIEQSFTTAAADKTNVPVADKTMIDMRDKKQQIDTSYTTEARLNLRDNKMNRDFYVMLTVNCYPDKQTVEIEPIDKASIVYVKPDQ